MHKCGAVMVVRPCKRGQYYQYFGKQNHHKNVYRIVPTSAYCPPPLPPPRARTLYHITSYFRYNISDVQSLLDSVVWPVVVPGYALVMVVASLVYVHAQGSGGSSDVNTTAKSSSNREHQSETVGASDTRTTTSTSGSGASGGGTGGSRTGGTGGGTGGGDGTGGARQSGWVAVLVPTQ